LQFETFWQFWRILKKMSNLLALFMVFWTSLPSTNTPAAVMSFVASDQTNLHSYDLSEYNCLNFASDLASRAGEAGFEASVVIVVFYGPPESAHAITRFETLDGPVFVDIDDARLSPPIVGEPLCNFGGGGCYQFGSLDAVGYYP
jgi:hypothetical protein